MEALFFLFFFIVLGMIVTQWIRGIARWNTNNHSPRLTVDAVVVSKRYAVSHHHHNHGTHTHVSHSTGWYVTFQVESGDRMELQMTGEEYGLLAEGDTGKLTFQGTRYLGFVRHTGGGHEELLR